MDVPENVLEKLKCRKCLAYLSRSPVYLEVGGAAMCGRCFSPDRPAARNKEYEAVAALLKFPCKNAELGCMKTVGFSEVTHEARCLYRQYVCPLHCSWVGPRSELLQHCQEQHPDHVLDNPCSLTHDITESSLHNYVLQAFQLLFLLLTKVCVTSGRIYHSVRLLDSNEEDFTFTVSIKRGDEVLTKRRSVGGGEEGLDISDWGGASCTVEVQRRWREQCSKCAAQVTRKLYRDKRGWRCEDCAPTKQACSNQADVCSNRGSNQADVCSNESDLCSHEDIPVKCKKHETYFCSQGTKCWICSMNVARGTLARHYTEAHSDVTHDAGSTWRTTKTGRWWYCLVTSPAGTAVCLYWLSNSGFALWVHMPVSSDQLGDYHCEIRVTQPSTGRSRTYTPNVTYESVCDWCIGINYQDFPAWTCEFDVSVDICKI